MEHISEIMLRESYLSRLGMSLDDLCGGKNQCQPCVEKRMERAEAIMDERMEP